MEALRAHLVEATALFHGEVDDPQYKSCFQGVEFGLTAASSRAFMLPMRFE